MMETQLTAKDYVEIIRRRFLFILLPAVLVGSATVAVAFVLPPIYESTGTILVESQQIPADLIRSTVTNNADERIQIIKQRVMTRENLLRIIDKFGLFRKERKAMPVSELVDEMRQRIAIELIDAPTGDPRRRNTTTIAFKVSFEHRQPDIAYKIANELVTLFLDENVKTRTARASETTEFLAQEAQKLRSRIDKIESQIAAYKQEHANSLPEHLELHIGMLERAESESKEVERDIKALEEERRYLDIQLTAARTGRAVLPDKTNPKSPAQELAALQSHLVELSALYGPEHPDVRATKRKIAALEKEVRPAEARTRLQDQLKAAQADLDEATGRYGKAHPDVKRLQSKVEAIRQELASIRSDDAQSSQATGEVADPVEAKVMAQVAASDVRLRSLREQRETLDKKIAELQDIVVQTPQVERGLKALSRDYDNELKKYDEIRSKQMEAQVAENLEEEKKAERFSLLEPPLLPETPVKPNRKKILAMGLFLAVASGGGVTVLREVLDQSVRGVRTVAAILGQPPLAVIPYLTTTQELRERARRRIWWVILTVLMLVAVGLAVNFLYKPLDILFMKALTRIEHM